jgi:hypothetical protein
VSRNGAWHGESNFEARFVTPFADGAALHK